MHFKHGSNDNLNFVKDAQTDFAAAESSASPFMSGVLSKIKDPNFKTVYTLSEAIKFFEVDKHSAELEALLHPKADEKTSLSSSSSSKLIMQYSEIAKAKLEQFQKSRLADSRAMENSPSSQPSQRGSKSADSSQSASTAKNANPANRKKSSNSKKKGNKNKNLRSSAPVKLSESGSGAAKAKQSAPPSSASTQQASSEQKKPPAGQDGIAQEGASAKSDTTSPQAVSGGDMGSQVNPAENPTIRNDEKPQSAPEHSQSSPAQVQNPAADQNQPS